MICPYINSKSIVHNIQHIIIYIKYSDIHTNGDDDNLDALLPLSTKPWGVCTPVHTSAGGQETLRAHPCQNQRHETYMRQPSKKDNNRKVLEYALFDLTILYFPTNTYTRLDSMVSSPGILSKDLSLLPVTTPTAAPNPKYPPHSNRP